MGICSDHGIQRIGVYCNKSLVLNYNIQKDSLDVYDKHLKELKKINELPSGFVDDYYQILMYVSDAVSYDLFLKNIRTRNLIREITREKFSKIAEIGDRLVEIVNDCEFDTPEKQVKIFNSFIDIFKLQQHLSVKIF